MVKSNHKMINFTKNYKLIFLKLVILLTPLTINKYVCEFRVNQEMLLKLFAFLILAFSLVEILTKKEIFFEKSKINLSIIFLVLLLTFSLIRSKYFNISLKDYLIFLSYFVLYFSTINLINNKDQFNIFVKIFFITSFLVSLYTLLHYYGMIPYFREFAPVLSTIGQKNWTSNYIALIFPVIFSYFLLEPIIKNKIIYYFLLVINYTTLIICQSRGIWISISFTLIIALYLIIRFNFLKIFKENKKWLFFLLTIFLIINIIYSTDNPLNKSALTVPQRALSTFDEQDPSINTRILM